MSRPTQEPRTAKVEVRLTPKEKEALERRAGDAGQSLSDFVRAQALGKATHRARRRPMPDDVAEVVRQLSACGNNLNQIARAMNMGERIEWGVPLQTALGELTRLMRGFGE